MDLFKLARGICQDILDGDITLATVQAEKVALAAEVRGGRGGLDLTSSTMDGQSFAGEVSMTKAQRLHALRLALRMANAGGTVSSRRSYVRGGQA